MLQNAYFLAKIGADTAENEQHLAEILPKIGSAPARAPPPHWPGRLPRRAGKPILPFEFGAVQSCGYPSILENHAAE